MKPLLRKLKRFFGEIGRDFMGFLVLLGGGPR